MLCMETARRAGEHSARLNARLDGCRRRIFSRKESGNRQSAKRFSDTIGPRVQATLVKRPVMPIRVFLKVPHSFDDEAIRVMGVAFECARSAVRDHGFDEVIAGKIIELAQAGERDVDKLCNFSVKGLPRPGGWE